MRHTLTQDAWWHDTYDINSFSVNTLIIDNSMQPQAIVMPSLPTNYSHPATGPGTTFGTSLPSHADAYLQTKLTENALRYTNNPKKHSDVFRMDEQTLSLGLMTLVPTYYDGLTYQDVRFNLNLRVGNTTNTYQLTKYTRTRSLVQNNMEANYGYSNITSMVIYIIS